MLKAAIEKILEIAPFHTEEIDGQTYSDRQLIRVPPRVDQPKEITVNSLDGIAQLIQAEGIHASNRIFLHIVNPVGIRAFSTYGDYFTRAFLYRADYDGPTFQEGFREQQKAIIELRSRFISNEGSEYLLNLLSRITKESTISSMDNGVTQAVEAKQGIALAAKVAVKPRVLLRPYRTFLEVEQPESEFLLRLNEDGNVGLFEADGGAWKQAAKANIKAYFNQALAEEIGAGKVVVLM